MLSKGRNMFYQNKKQETTEMGESRIPVPGKSVSSPTGLSSRLASLSHRLRPNAGGGMLLGLLGPATRSKSSKRQQHHGRQQQDTPPPAPDSPPQQPAPNGVRPQRPTCFQKALEGHRSFRDPRQNGTPREDSETTEWEKVSGAHVGRRVVLGGCKWGVLRFYGPSELGGGLWCGVELDSAEGLNDGTVNGVRYFTCPPLRGVLAPEEKVAAPAPRPQPPPHDSGPRGLLVVAEPGGVSPDSGASSPPASRPPSFDGSAPLVSSRHSSSAGSLVPKAIAGSLQDASLQHSKHSSFEFDESLGILTPDQMTDFTVNYTLDDIGKTPSCDELSSLMLQDLEFSDLTMDSSKRNSLEVKDDRDSLPEDNSTFVSHDTLDATLVPYDDSCVRESEESGVSSLTVVNGDRSLNRDTCLSARGCDLSEELSDNIESKKSSDPLSSYCQVGKRDRLNRTPSVEDLPLDASESERKGGGSVVTGEDGCRGVVLPNSFITSITSITSLDNGYQGDGEWSRPASRGPPDHSPSAHQKLVKPRIDPMTDSDFFTESDADVHEEFSGNGHLVGNLIGKGGDRRARVIDGTLYGGGTPATANSGGCNHPCNSFTVNCSNRQNQRFSPTNEEMDSSGIYSDLDRKGEEQNYEEIKSLPEDDMEIQPPPSTTSLRGPGSPEGSIRTVSSRSDQSLKKLSPTAFTELINEQVNTIKNLVASSIESEYRYEPYEEIATQTVEEDLVAPVQQTAIREDPKVKPPVNNKMEPGFVKKYKMPKRNVVSKIKTMISSGTSARKENEEPGEQGAEVPRIVSKPPKKGRWDEVMSKISQGQAASTTQRLKEVKSKVFAGICLQPQLQPNAQARHNPSVTPTRKSCSTRSLPTPQSVTARSLRDISTLKSKSRRSRLRGSENCLPAQSQASSRNSSVSDLSQQTKASTPTSTHFKKRSCLGHSSCHYWHDKSKLVPGGWGQAVGIRLELLYAPDMVQYSVNTRASDYSRPLSGANTSVRERERIFGGGDIWCGGQPGRLQTGAPVPARILCRLSRDRTGVPPTPLV
ncbi:hypothetical protein AAG570_006549 [Ranatra chinensis]|uniref:CAP-Gly domain-containing protein n=1 Tax=Ranatra chinensis TaxID=642074 RepID=A0ABD0Z730_9HEMI